MTTPATLYVEARQCTACTHVGLNDSSDTLSVCTSCTWSGDTPAEDCCPGCGTTGTMAAACPKCGESYVLMAESELPLAATAPNAGARLAEARCHSEHCPHGADCALAAAPAQQAGAPLTLTEEQREDVLDALRNTHGLAGDVEEMLDAVLDEVAAVGAPLPLAPSDEVARIVHLRTARDRRIYIAGPMTGLPDFNFPAFNAKAAELRAEGWHVENPAEHGHVEGAGWADYLRWDISRIATCGAVYLLPGWEASKGAALEVTIASTLGITFLGAAPQQALPLAPREAGLNVAQEPKYTVNGHAIVNRASGEEIPADEPVFIFRARDRIARWMLVDYAGRCIDIEHAKAVQGRVHDFDKFSFDHPDRMKWPDTAPAATPQQATLPAAPLQELHDLLYSAQRTTGEPQAKAIGAARVVLHKLRATLPAREQEPIAWLTADLRHVVSNHVLKKSRRGDAFGVISGALAAYSVPAFRATTRAQPQVDACAIRYVGGLHSTWKCDACGHNDVHDAHPGCRRTRPQADAAGEQESWQGDVPDGVWESLQRLIENGAHLGPASADDALLVARYRRHLLAATPAPQADAAEEPVQWGDPKTVGMFIRQLQTIDPEAPIHAALHADYEGKRRAMVRGVTLSRERVKGRFIETGDTSVPYAHVVWSQPQADAAEPVADPFREHLARQAERINVEQLAAALTWMGSAPAGEGQEGFVARLAENVNRLTRAVASHKSATEAQAPGARGQA